MINIDDDLENIRWKRDCADYYRYKEIIEKFSQVNKSVFVDYARQRIVEIELKYPNVKW